VHLEKGVLVDGTAKEGIKEFQQGVKA